MNEQFRVWMLQRFTNQLVLVDTPVGMYSGVLRRVGRSRHKGIGCLLLETRVGWLLIKAWIAIKTSTADADATLSRSLRAVETSGKKFLNGKAVANNVVKLLLGGYGETPLNCHVERLRNMGGDGNGEF